MMTLFIPEASRSDNHVCEIANVVRHLYILCSDLVALQLNRGNLLCLPKFYWKSTENFLDFSSLTTASSAIFTLFQFQYSTYSHFIRFAVQLQGDYKI